LANLQDREKKLKKQLAEKQKAKRKLDKAIDDLVRKERIANAKKKSHSLQERKNVTSANFFHSPRKHKNYQAILPENKGKLPWPVEKGKYQQ
jgi:septal ring factor EnvC (AmiA/AmiB activator)